MHIIGKYFLHMESDYYVIARQGVAISWQYIATTGICVYAPPPLPAAPAGREKAQMIPGAFAPGII